MQLLSPAKFYIALLEGLFFFATTAVAVPIEPDALQMSGALNGPPSNPSYIENDHVHDKEPSIKGNLFVHTTVYDSTEHFTIALAFAVREMLKPAIPSVLASIRTYHPNLEFKKTLADIPIPYLTENKTSSANLFDFHITFKGTDKMGKHWSMDHPDEAPYFGEIDPKCLEKSGSGYRYRQGLLTGKIGRYRPQEEVLVSFKDGKQIIPGRSKGKKLLDLLKPPGSSKGVLVT
ncbi:hypothetical protein F5050DRAFT_1791369 [Lentinula boryana]|uniref:Uncharacterized protein n=1 Tax=Lentinula boryana TaxID=40481 RepID=A0ABQ8Q0L7_9AGAR|nr:hypothetical protein F5050DRAFT_1791369 [Lentinula boryana]